jgi:FtsH-binding integral membrane protein
MGPGTSKGSLTISIWFFIGISLLVNGVIILGAGVHEIIQPPPLEAQVVLFQYHASVWWGALLTMLGGFYCWHFAPWRANK